MPVVFRKNFMGLLVPEPVFVFSVTVTNSQIHSRCVNRSNIPSQLDSTLRKSLLDQVKFYKILQYQKERSKEEYPSNTQSKRCYNIQLLDTYRLYTVCIFHIDLVSSVSYLDATTQSCYILLSMKSQ